MPDAAAETLLYIAVLLFPLTGLHFIMQESRFITNQLAWRDFRVQLRV